MQSDDIYNHIHSAIARLRSKRAAGNATPNDAIALARDTETDLATIAADNPGNANLASIGTEVAAEMLNALIDSINRGGKDMFHTLASAAKALLYIDRIPLAAEFVQNRYEPERRKIRMLLERYHIEPRSIYPIDYHPTLDEDAYYAQCNTPEDLARYMQRHPHGRHISEAHTRISKAQKSIQSRKNMRRTAWRTVAVLATLAIIGACCAMLGLHLSYTAGTLLITLAVFSLYFSSKSQASHLKRYLAGSLMFLALCGAGVAVMLTGAQRQQRAILDGYIANGDEDGLIACMTDNPGSHYANEALHAYLALMDSIFFDPEAMDRPAQIPPLARMENLSRSAYINDEMRRIITDRVTRRTDSLYALTVADGSIDAWEKYQRLAPSELYYDSSERIDSIDNLIWSTEPTAWQRASRLNSKDAYSRYIDIYPSGTHASAARARLIDFEVKDYRNQGLVIVDNIDRVCDIDEAGSRVGIYNNSDYQVTMLLSGPTSAQLVIPPHDYAETSVADGDYQILARVANPQHDKFSFAQSFNHGYYSSTIEINREQ